MDLEAHKAVVRRYREIYNSNQLDALDGVLATDFMPHNMAPGLPPNIEGAKRAHQVALAMFPDLHISTEELVADRDKVIERWIQTCTDTGTPFFIGNIPATGRKVTTTGISIYRIANGKIAEHWGEFDFAAVLRQMGVTYGAG